MRQLAATTPPGRAVTEAGWGTGAGRSSVSVSSSPYVAAENACVSRSSSSWVVKRPFAAASRRRSATSSRSRSEVRRRSREGMPASVGARLPRAPAPAAVCQQAQPHTRTRFRIVAVQASQRCCCSRRRADSNRKPARRAHEAPHVSWTGKAGGDHEAEPATTSVCGSAGPRPGNPRKIRGDADHLHRALGLPGRSILSSPPRAASRPRAGAARCGGSCR